MVLSHQIIESHYDEIGKNSIAFFGSQKSLLLTLYSLVSSSSKLNKESVLLPDSFQFFEDTLMVFLSLSCRRELGLIIIMHDPRDIGLLLSSMETNFFLYFILINGFYTVSVVPVQYLNSELVLGSPNAHTLDSPMKPLISQHMNWRLLDPSNDLTSKSLFMSLSRSNTNRFIFVYSLSLMIYWLCIRAIISKSWASESSISMKFSNHCVS